MALKFTSLVLDWLKPSQMIGSSSPKKLSLAVRSPVDRCRNISHLHLLQCFCKRTCGILNKNSHVLLRNCVDCRYQLQYQLMFVVMLRFPFWDNSYNRRSIPCLGMKTAVWLLDGANIHHDISFGTILASWTSVMSTELDPMSNHHHHCSYETLRIVCKDTPQIWWHRKVLFVLVISSKSTHAAVGLWLSVMYVVQSNELHYVKELSPALWMIGMYEIDHPPLGLRDWGEKCTAVIRTPHQKWLWHMVFRRVFRIV